MRLPCCDESQHPASRLLLQDKRRILPDAPRARKGHLRKGLRAHSARAAWMFAGSDGTRKLRSLRCGSSRRPAPWRCFTACSWQLELSRGRPYHFSVDSYMEESETPGSRFDGTSLGSIPNQRIESTISGHELPCQTLHDGFQSLFHW